MGLQNFSIQMATNVDVIHERLYRNVVNTTSFSAKNADMKTHSCNQGQREALEQLYYMIRGCVSKKFGLIAPKLLENDMPVDRRFLRTWTTKYRPEFNSWVFLFVFSRYNKFSQMMTIALEAKSRCELKNCLKALMLEGQIEGSLFEEITLSRQNKPWGSTKNVTKRAEGINGTTRKRGGWGNQWPDRPE